MYGFVAIICGGFVFGCLYDAAFTQEEQWQISKYIGAAFLLGVGWLLAVLFGGFGVLIDCAMAAVVILCNWNTIKANYHSPDAVKARAAWAQRYTTAGRWDATARDLGQRVSAFKASRAVVDEWVRQPEPVLQPEPKPEPRQAPYDREPVVYEGAPSPKAGQIDPWAIWSVVGFMALVFIGLVIATWPSSDASASAWRPAHVAHVHGRHHHH